MDTLSSSTTQPSIPISSLLDISSEKDPITHAERQVKIALDDLVKRGVLQKLNGMDIESLLNPAGKSHILSETSDHEIYQAVMDAINAREKIDINGGNDVDNNISIQPRPTRREVLKPFQPLGHMQMI